MRLEAVIQRDTRANQPAANTVPVGTLFYVTDEFILERSNGTSWQSYSGVAPADVFSNRRRQIAAWTGQNNVPIGDTFGGSWTISGGAADASGADGLFRSMNQPSLNGNATFRVSSFYHVQSRLNPYYKGIMRVNQAGAGFANVRIFFGLASAAEVFASDTPNATYVGIRFIPGVDTNWTAVVCDGTGASTSTIDTGVAVTEDLKYEVEIWTEDAGVTWNFSINGSSAVTLNTNVPTVTTYLGPLFTSRNTGGTSNQRVQISRLYLEMEP